MPIYELVCRDCGHEESMMCSWNKRQEAVCSACGSKSFTQKFTSVGIMGSKSGSDSTKAPPSRRSGFT